ncbi:MAG: hypothetical protein VSS75_021390, partial [Candidatus Parabeggiatoa sp.]|nr:hypothetical protein [Candidatus Parabeggiatoa sp.]
MGNAVWADGSLVIKPISATFAPEDSEQTFTLSNRGDVPLHIDTIEVATAITTDAVGNVTTLRSTEFTISKDDCSGKDIPASAECEVLTEFNPASEGEKTATVFVSTEPQINRYFTAKRREASRLYNSRFRRDAML